VGHQLWRTRPQQQGGKGGFVVGSSGVEYALLAEWQRLGLVEGGEDFTPPRSVERIAVVSGSVSSTTARQIHWAVEHAGFQRIELDARSLAIPAHRNEAMATAILKALDALSSGRSVILHTAMGPDSHDDSLATESSRHSLGKALGEMLKALVDDQGLTRVCVAGGDTSSHAITALNIHALTVKMPLPDTPGSPLCQAHSDDPRYQDLEIAFKGGQIGGDDYFERLRRGRALADHEH